MTIWFCIVRAEVWPHPFELNTPGAGYVFNRYDVQMTSANEVGWLGEYYIEKDQLQDAIRVFEYIADQDENNILVFRKLMQLHAQTGNKPMAIYFAQILKQLDPASASQYDAFINSLQ